ncbi:PRC-barrel domain-containing protein [Azospirillum sp. ST 5-10]|uniref:PRC-barrel domain-containing protein n=1 Tax=unclassified Azospirillum TaxID=2630922 RepID=UPI003F49C507
MSVKTLLTAAATAALLSAAPALAQTTLDPAAPTVAPSAAPSAGMAAGGDLDPMLMQQRIDDLEDADVYGADGKEIGEIEEIVRRDGQLYAVFDADEFLDTSDRDFAIPLDHFRYVNERLTLPLTEEQVDALQEFKKGDFEDYAEEHDMTVGDLYGAR